MEKKTRLLCLHGWGTNREIMKHQLRNFKATIGNVVEFVIPEAPNIIKKQTDLELQKRFPGVYYEWFHSKKRVAEDGSVDYLTVGIETSIAYLERFIEEQGPFDGVLGFSLGAVMALVLLSLNNSGRLRTSFKFGILVATGMLVNTGYWANLPQDFPLLFITGTNDPLKYNTFITATYFHNTQFLPTNADHRIPKLTDEETQKVMNFIQSNLPQPKL